MMEQNSEALSRSMSGTTDITGVADMRVRLSALWVFAVLNYIYADVFTALDPSPGTGSVHMSHGMMLGAAVLMETAIIMVPLSRLLKYRANRCANLVAGTIHTVAVIASLFVGGAATASYYVLFASVEVVSTLLILGYAWRWRSVSVVEDI